MTIVVTGGGSGGHITPILAVASELKRLQPQARIVYIGQKGDSLSDIPANDPNIDACYHIRAGKFRRYHGEGLKQLLDLRTMALNARDAGFVVAGLGQSRRLLKRLKPDVVFVKGGFVGVPVGLAAAQLGIPYVTHDSDAIPGLANRLISRWASRHAVALPKEVYAYPPSKTVTTGIPLQADFVPVTTRLKATYRQELKIPLTAKLLFIIGGGLGSQRINRAVAEVVPHLLREFRDLYVVHGVGRANELEMHALYKENLTEPEQERVHLFGYTNDVYRYSGAADIVVTRAGATNLAEFALQGKACIVIPSPFLAAGHQLKNARLLAEQAAVCLMNETDLQADPNRLAKQVSRLLRDDQLRHSLEHNLAKFGYPAAARNLAQLLLEQANGTRGRRP